MRKDRRRGWTEMRKKGRRGDVWLGKDGNDHQASSSRAGFTFLCPRLASVQC